MLAHLSNLLRLLASPALLPELSLLRVLRREDGVCRGHGGRHGHCLQRRGQPEVVHPPEEDAGTHGCDHVLIDVEPGLGRQKERQVGRFRLSAVIMSCKGVSMGELAHCFKKVKCSIVR